MRAARPLIGLALSGGTARSVAHVGVLRALAESDITVDRVAGTSGGAIAAVCLAAGMPVARMEELANDLTWRKLAAIKIGRLGFASSKRIELFLEKIFGAIQFDDLQIPCAVVATDLANGAPAVFNHGAVPRAVRASCSLPQIFLPVEIGGKYYVDGGISQYLPVQTARSLGADFVIAVNLGTRNRKIKPPRHILEMTMQFIQIMADNNTGPSLARADFVITPDLSGFGSFDFSVSEKVIAKGHAVTKQTIPALKEALAKHQTLRHRIKSRLLARYLPGRPAP